MLSRHSSSLCATRILNSRIWFMCRPSSRRAARLSTREEGVELLRPGDLGLATPADPDMYGYISEQHGYGMTAQESGEQAEDLAATMLRHLASTLIPRPRGMSVSRYTNTAA